MKIIAIALATGMIVASGLGMIARGGSTARAEVVVAAVTMNEGAAAGDAVVVHSNCPSDMVEIEGMYCQNIEEICLYDVDGNGNRLSTPHDPNAGRCGEWKYPSRCLGDKVYKHYCIDTYELPNRKGAIPLDWLTYTDVENIGKQIGKRVCLASEWSMASEGPDADPIGYGDGYHRSARHSICNTDNVYPRGIDVFKATSPDSPAAQVLHNMLVPSGSMPECHSKYNVFDLTANIDEWVKNDTGHGLPTGLMSGHIFGVRYSSRAITTSHNGDANSVGGGFRWYETGGRLCKDVQ